MPLLSKSHAGGSVPHAPLFCCAALLALLPVPAGAQVIRLEAEDGTLAGTTTASSAAGYSGTGYVTGFDQADDRVSWEFQAAAAGLYRVAIGFRTPHGQKGFAGAINGLGISGMFPAQNSWGEFDLGLASLPQGSNTAWVGGSWNWYEIDYIQFTPAALPDPPLPVDPTPVDPQASPETVALLEYLASIYGSATLSGQQEAPDFNKVQTRTGVLPAILAGDLIEYSPSRRAHGSNPGNTTESYGAMVDNGALLTLCWHWNAPTDLINSGNQPWWRGFYTTATTLNIATVLADPSGERYQLLLRDIDAIAVELKKLQAARIPVLWRPLHEAEGGWFWWGAQGAEPFKELWRLLFDRLTNHHGIHNLIWVFTGELEDWYPGDAYVDIIGVDAYPDDMADTLAPRWQAMRDLYDGRKMVSLSEFGGVPDVPAMQALSIWWLYFASWTGDLGPDAMSDADLQRIYTDQGVVTLGELPDDPMGRNWAGNPIFGGGYTQTDFLGVLWVGPVDGWAWSFSLQSWVWVLPSYVGETGAWTYVGR